MQTPAADRRHRAGKQTVIRTVGTTQDPVRYMYADLSADPPAAHELLPQQTRAETPTARKPTVSAFQTALSGSSCDFRERLVPAHA